MDKKEKLMSLRISIKEYNHLKDMSKYYDIPMSQILREGIKLYDQVDLDDINHSLKELK